MPAAAQVFALVGDGGQPDARRLLGDSRVHLVTSPRHASVLLVLGALPEALHTSARRVHDQLPAPRATVAFDPDGRANELFPGAEVVRRRAHVAEVVVRVHRELFGGERRSERLCGPEENPVEWKGVGPYGQGGEGMMGGKPYGRSMAMTGPDIRDGLALDRVEVPLGPFLRWLPPGLSLELVLQGDVVQEARIDVAPFGHRDESNVFQRALREQVTIAELELERARHHLFATAELLRLHGLDAQAFRAARLAVELRAEDEKAILRLTRWLRWTGALRMGTRGVGLLDANTLENWTGPVARAAGVKQDARAEDPAYRSLGFAPIIHERSDADARWQQRLAEAAQSVSLARRAGDLLRSPGPALEGPRGRVGRGGGVQLRELLEQIAVGQAFDAYATTLVSLDLDTCSIPQRSDSEEHENEEDQEGNRGEGQHRQDGSGH